MDTNRATHTRHRSEIRRWRHFIVLLVLCAMIAAACGSDTKEADSATNESVGTAVVAAPTAAPSLEATPQSTEQVAEPAATTTGTATGTAAPSEDDPSDNDHPLSFEDCGQGAECAIVAVPLDYNSPNGGTTNIHVTRRRATGEPIGTLFLNPGGPGGATEDMVKGISRSAPAPLGERFDIIGIDPRGTGKSVPISCNDNWEEDVARIPSPEDGLQDDVDVDLADFDTMAEACEQRYGVAYLASITTENAARDMETIRLALGDEPLSYLGYSYGTAIGSVYATLFPESIRSMILDGAVPTNLVDSRNADVEQALVRLDRSCALWSECPVGEAGLLNAIDAVRSDVQKNGSIGMLSILAFQSAVETMVVKRDEMPRVAQGLVNALDGDGSLLTSIGSGSLTPLDGGGYAQLSGAMQAIVCADGWASAAGTAGAMLEQAEYTASTYPALGPKWDVPCDHWPVSGNGIPAISYAGDAQILVVGNTGDAITPLRWSEQMVEDLGPKATLLTWDGSNHTVVFSGATSCIDDAAVSYLIDGQVPAPGTQCVLRGLMGIGHNTVGPVIIDYITPGSPADQVGLQLGDKITAENDNPISSAADFAIGAAGENVELEIERDGETITVPITRGTPIWELWMTDETG